MKRFHVHLHVDDLVKSVGFCSTLFATEPARLEGVTDPQGIAWEHFHTLATIPVFNEAAAQASTGSACCAPAEPTVAASAEPVARRAPTPRGKPIGIPIKSSTSCC